MKAKKIKKHSKIGIISPASSANKNKIYGGKRYLEKLGFEVILGDNTFSKLTYLSNDDEQRAEEINNMFKMKEIEVILCTRGGYGTPRILELLDYELIRNNPKIIIGFSDITAILNTIMQKTDLIVFHGPMLASNMSDSLDEYTFKSLFSTLKGEQSEYLLENPKNNKIQSLNDGKATGQIVGGNLALISSLMGTPYEVDTKGKLLFLEDIGEKPYKIDRMLTQLKLAGKFKDASGVILGNWNDCTDENDSFAVDELIEQIIKPCGKPIIKNLQSGHCTPMLTIPIGVMAEIDATNKTVKVLEKSVE